MKAAERSLDYSQIRHQKPGEGGGDTKNKEQKKEKCVYIKSSKKISLMSQNHIVCIVVSRVKNRKTRRGVLSFFTAIANA